MAENNQKDYKNGKIYCIRNNINDDIYVGSTTQPLCKRMAWHRQSAKKKNKMHQTFYSKFNEIGVENFYIELIEECPCESLEQLRKREGEFIREMGTLNSLIAGRTKKEYCEANKDKIKEYKQEWYEANKEEIKERHKEYNKEYREQNKDKIKERHKEYKKLNKEKIQQQRHEFYEANKNKWSEKIICACGGKYTVCHKSPHEKSQKHQQYIQQCNV